MDRKSLAKKFSLYDANGRISVWFLYAVSLGMLLLAVLLIPPANAQVETLDEYRGTNFLLAENIDDTGQNMITLELDPWVEAGYLDEKGRAVFTPHKLSGGGNYVTVEAGSISLTVIEDSCTAKVFDGGLVDGKQPKIEDLNYILQEAVNGTDNWVTSSIDDATCSISTTESGDTVSVVTQQTDGSGLVKEIEYLVNPRGLETFLRAINDDPNRDDIKFGFVESITGATEVKINGVESSVGSLTREEVIGKNIEINGLRYDPKNEVHDYLWGLSVEDRKTEVAFKNAKNALGVGNTLEIDPTFSPAEFETGLNDNDNDDICESSPSSVGSNGNLQTYRYSTSSSIDCVRWYEWADISIIPDTAVITNVFFDAYRVDFVNDSQNCSITGLTSNPTSQTNAQNWANIETHTPLITNDNFCTSVNLNFDLDLTVAGDVYVQNQLSDDYVAFGIRAHNDIGALDGTTRNTGHGGTATDRALNISYETQCAAPTSLTATANGDAIDLSWTDNCSTEDGYKIERRIGTGSWSTIVADTGNTNTSYSDSTVAPTTDYGYRITPLQTVDSGTYEGITSSEATETSNPDPPTGLSATAVSDSQINLSWTAPSQGTVDGYKIERESPVGGGFSTLVADTGDTNTTYQDTGLTDSTVYNYRISALNGADSSAPSNEANDTTFGAPDQVTGLTVTPASTSQLNLSWNTPDDNGFAITGYKIEVESPVGGGFTVLVADTGTTATTYNDTTLSSGTEYNYRVSAINSFGTGTASAAESDYTLLDAPTSLIATATTGTTIDLSWSAPSGTVTGYKIERESPIGGGFSTLVADTGTTSTTYEDSGLSLGTQYNYRVSAINTNADVTDTSSPSNEDAATTFDLPSAPLNLFANATGFSSINLDWDAPADSGSTAISGYRIWSESPVGGGWSVLVNDTQSISTNHDDTGLTQNTQYNYKVQAWNSVGAGDNSTASSATTWEPVTGTVTIDQTHIIGDVLEANVTASMNFASPDPTIVSISLINVTGTASSQSINLVNDTFSAASFRLWGEFNGTKDIVAQLNILNATNDTILLNSTSQEFTVEYEPNTFTSIEGNIPVNYTVNRINNDQTINLKVNRGDDPTWNAECNFRTHIFGEEQWQNLTGVGAYEVNQTAERSKNTYIKCYNDQLLFTTVSFGATNATLALTDFTDQMGTFLGVPIPFIFIIFLAAIFTGRSAPTGVFILGGAIGVMAIMGMFPDPTTGDPMITGTVFGFVILLVVLGCFAGKRYFIAPLAMFTPYFAESLMMSQKATELML